MATAAAIVGSVVSLWRYPVKSMQGEELNASVVTERGLFGDRMYALVDAGEGRVASAKNPRKWPGLFDYRAAFPEPPGKEPFPAVRITLPDGSTVSSRQADRDARLSEGLGRKVALSGAAPAAPVLEEYWPDTEGLPHRDTVTEEQMPAGTFFDVALIHIVTTTTLDAMRGLYPQGRFEVRRFRPNIVIACDTPDMGFPEQGWVGKTLALGDAVQLQVTGRCGRCVMTTLPQADLPRDPGILRALAQHNQGIFGVYAGVVRGGLLRRGDAVRLD